jgi:chemotaxis protein histidine kinase CheA
VVVVEMENGSKAGLVVDELIGQQQVVVKSLSENAEAVAGISGATILGNGRVALILDIEGICAMPDRAALLDAGEDFQLPAGVADNSPVPQGAEISSPRLGALQPQESRAGA